MAKKGSRRHTIDYSVIPSLDYKHHFLDVQVLPLPDVNGNRATAATVDVWYTKSLGRNHDLIEAQSSFRIKVRQRALRRLKIGGFSTHCAVIYTLKGVRYDDGSGFVGVGNIKPGCNPPPASYDDGLVRGCW